jgi:threonine synthase
MFAMQVARETGGHIEWCTEDEIRDGITLLAETEGVFTETAGGVTIANLRRMCEQGIVKPDEETVAYITGNGYKTVEALVGHMEPSYSVGPDLDEFLTARAVWNPRSTWRRISTSSSPRSTPERVVAAVRID